MHRCREIYYSLGGFCVGRQTLTSVHLLFRYFVRALFQIVKELPRDVIDHTFMTLLRVSGSGRLHMFVCGLCHRFAKDMNHFTINDLVKAEPTNALAVAVGGEAIRKPIEGARNEVVIDLIVSVIGVRPILQAIHRIGELTDFGVSDCEFDFIQ